MTEALLSAFTTIGLLIGIGVGVAFLMVVVYACTAIYTYAVTDYRDWRLEESKRRRH